MAEEVTADFRAELVAVLTGNFKDARIQHPWQTGFLYFL